MSGCARCHAAPPKVKLQTFRICSVCVDDFRPADEAVHKADQKRHDKALRTLPTSAVVERLIAAEAKNRLLESILRDAGEQEGDRSLGAYVIALKAHIERLTNERAAKQAA